jgi:hypothetical protein
VYERLSGQVAEAGKAFDALYATTLPAFNEAMRARGSPSS